MTDQASQESPAAAIERTHQAILDEGAVLCIRMSAGAEVMAACRAAIAGGLRVLEITLTTPNALAVIAELAREEGVIVGAGTVLDAEQVEAVAEARGAFVFSPVCDAAVLAAATRLGLLAVPGASTPTEVLSAHRLGAAMVKVFPAGALGGPNYLRAIRGPLPDIPLIPTSGPDADTIGEYFAAGAAVVGVAKDVFPPGFKVSEVQSAAARVRAALDAARG